MKVIARALEIWGDEEAMGEERERRANARDKKKQKQFDKKVKGEHRLSFTNRQSFNTKANEGQVMRF